MANTATRTNMGGIALAIGGFLVVFALLIYVFAFDPTGAYTEESAPAAAVAPESDAAPPATGN